MGFDLGHIFEFELDGWRKALGKKPPEVRFRFWRETRPANDSQANAVLLAVDDLKFLHVLILLSHHEDVAPETGLDDAAVFSGEDFADSAEHAFEHAQRTATRTIAAAELSEIADAIPDKGHRRFVQPGYEQLTRAGVFLLDAMPFDLQKKILLIDVR